MDESKTKIEPLTPEQLAWYAEQEAKCRKSMKSDSICMLVWPIFAISMLAIFLITIFVLKFNCLGGDSLKGYSDLVYIGIFAVGTVFILLITLIIRQFASNTEKKLEKLQRERLFHEK